MRRGLLVLVPAWTSVYDGGSRVAPTAVENSDQRGVVLAVGAISSIIFTVGMVGALILGWRVGRILQVKVQGVMFVGFVLNNFIASFAALFIWHESCQRDVSRASHRSGARGEKDAKVATACSTVLRVEIVVGCGVAGVIRASRY